MISIRQPLFFSKKGEKLNQEDCLFPYNPDKESRVFILCDGMGGHEAGEVASETVCDSLGTYLSSCANVDLPTFETGLSKAYDALNLIDAVGEKKPGTTMACLCINSDNYLVSHIGDSRIYHIRPSLFDNKTRRGGILYQSYDHSLVNDLLKAGEISAEEARNFPQRNVITRAMQPDLVNRFKADTYIFDDIKYGDYFFICSDGILEHLFADTLCEILANPTLNDLEKLRAIQIICNTGTKDNYSCWLIPIDRVRIKKQTSTSDVILAESNPAIQKRSTIDRIFNPKVKKVLSWCFYFILLCTLVFLIYEIWMLLFSYKISFPDK